jgi:hypothetical protein
MRFSSYILRYLSSKVSLSHLLTMRLCWAAFCSNPSEKEVIHQIHKQIFTNHLMELLMKTRVELN